VLLAKLPHFQWEVQERGRIGARYSAALQDFCIVPAVAPGNTHVYAQYTIRLPERDQVAERLKALGIPTAVHIPNACMSSPCFPSSVIIGATFQSLKKASREVLSLPMHPFLAPDQQDRIVHALQNR